MTRELKGEKELEIAISPPPSSCGSLLSHDHYFITLYIMYPLREVSSKDKSQILNIFYINVKHCYKHFTCVNATESKQQPCDKETEALKI